MAISLCLADLIALIGQLTDLGRNKYKKICMNRQIEKRGLKKKRGGEAKKVTWKKSFLLSIYFRQGSVNLFLHF